MVTMSQGKMEKQTLPKRFYKQAAFAAADGGYVITLDGKQVKTPAKQLLHVSRETIAAAIAAEWEAQGEFIDPATMPLTRLAHIALDRVPQDRDALLKDIAQYVETDLLCYRAPVGEAGPLSSANEGLRKKQDTTFDPILSWVEKEYGASFAITDGVLPIDQPAESQTRIVAEFSVANDDELAALAMMVPMLGSALLALALWKGHIVLSGGLEAARLDEAAQEEAWGKDPLVAAAWAAKVVDIQAAVFYLTAK